MQKVQNVKSRNNHMQPTGRSWVNNTQRPQWAPAWEAASEALQPKTISPISASHHQHCPLPQSCTGWCTQSSSQQSHPVQALLCHTPCWLQWVPEVPA